MNLDGTTPASARAGDRGLRRAVEGMLEAKMAEMNGAKTIDELMVEHRALDAQVEALSKKQYLTQAEQMEHAILKKKRLRARDQLFELSRSSMTR